MDVTMDPMLGVIAAVRVQREALLAQIAKLDAALEALGALLPADPAPHGGPRKVATPATTPTRTARARTAAPSADALGETLLGFLKKQPQPLRDLISLSGATRYLVNQALEQLASQKLAHAEGHTTQRMWHLGALTARSAPPAKEAVRRGRA